MKTLLIDNFDSFTWNLFHLIARINGEPPVVIKNNDPDWQLASLQNYDNVIISPGPGNPMRNADFGICHEVIQQGNLPILGVCLGHQGLSYISGARVDLAPEPMHGRISKVFHNGRGLFQDIPSPFNAVRYHSLAVYDLPANMQTIATSEDGVLMGVQHNTEPLWGVQFHPESICSEYGEQIIKNFFDLTRLFQAKNENSKPKNANAEHSLELDSEEKKLCMVVEKFDLEVESVVIFEKLYKNLDYSYWLDSSSETTEQGRFSFMGDASGSLGRILFYNVNDCTLEIQSNQKKSSINESFFSWIKKDLKRFSLSPVALPFDFRLGWAGYLGYELKAECQGELAHQSPFPDALMMFSCRGIALDHHEKKIYLLGLAEEHNIEQLEELNNWISVTKDAIRKMGSTPRVVATVAPSVRQGPADLELRHTKENYLDLIEKSQHSIKYGESYEICLTNMVFGEVKIDPWAGYLALRKISPTAFSAWIAAKEFWVLSGSPERFMKVDANGNIESKPIKGTRPRGMTQEEDKIITCELLSSEKDRAENLMIVDLVRNDIGICAEVGSVAVSNLFDIETYTTVHQMVSTIVGKLDESYTSVDLIKASFPGGSMTGAPKKRTMEIIDELEGGYRGIYSGAIGYFSLNGAADFSIVIRTAVATNEGISFGIGGAITHLSDAEDEFQETVVKSKTILNVLNVEFPERGLKQPVLKDVSLSKIRHSVLNSEYA